MLDVIEQTVGEATGDGVTIEELLNLYRYSNSVAFFEAYFDESGTHDDASHTFVAGFIAKQSSWLSMSNQWQRVLSKFNVESCHAKDLHNLRGEFSKWNEENRRSFIN